MNTVAISLSKALKVKSRLAGRLVKTTQAIQGYNSAYEGSAAKHDVKSWDTLRADLVNALTTLKVEIFKANRDVYQIIVELGEKKSEIEFLNSLPTRDGAEPGYNGTAVVYVAALTATDVASRIKRLEKEIDDLQDQLDSYNAVPERIRVPQKVMELAS